MLLSHWKLDGNGNDSEGNKNLTSVGPIFYTDGINQGQSALLNGSNTCLYTNEQITNVNQRQLTISLWMLIGGGSGSWRCAIHKASTTAVGASEYWIGASVSNNIIATYGARSSGYNHSSGDTGVRAELNTWYHVVLTWDGNTVRNYVNGVRCAEYAYSLNPFISHPTIIGASSITSSTYQFPGIIDDVRIYNAALGMRSVQLLYSNEYTKKIENEINKNLLLHYSFNRFDEGSLNHIFNGNFEENILRVPFTSVVNGTLTRVSEDSQSGIFGRHCLKHVKTNPGLVSNTNNISGTSNRIAFLQEGITAIFSIWVKSEDFSMSVSARLHKMNSLGTVIAEEVESLTAQPTEWKQLVVKIKSLAGEGTVGVSCSVMINNTSLDKAVYWDGAKLEIRDFPTVGYIHGEKNLILKDDSGNMPPVSAIGRNAFSLTKDTPINKHAAFFSKRCYVAATPVTTNSSFSISYFVRFKELTNIVDGDGTWIINQRGTGSSGNRDWQHYIYRNSGQLRFDITNTSGSNFAHDLTTSSPQLNRWYYVAIVVEKTSASNEDFVITSYVMDLSQSSPSFDIRTTSGTGVFQNIATGLTISGRGWDKERSSLNGDIADVRIYGSALKEKDLREILYQRASIDKKGSLFANEVKRYDGVIELYKYNRKEGEPFEVYLAEDKTYSEYYIFNNIKRQMVNEEVVEWFEYDVFFEESMPNARFEMYCHPFNGRNDSFFYSFDDEPFNDIHTGLSSGNKYVWITFDERAVTKGKHRIRISLREETKMSAMRIQGATHLINEFVTKNGVLEAKTVAESGPENGLIARYTLDGTLKEDRMRTKSLIADSSIGYTTDFNGGTTTASLSSPMWVGIRALRSYSGRIRAYSIGDTGFSAAGVVEVWAGNDSGAVRMVGYGEKEVGDLFVVLDIDFRAGDFFYILDVNGSRRSPGEFTLPITGAYFRLETTDYRLSNMFTNTSHPSFIYGFSRIDILFDEKKFFIGKKGLSFFFDEATKLEGSKVLPNDTTSFSCSVWFHSGNDFSGFKYIVHYGPTRIYGTCIFVISKTTSNRIRFDVNGLNVTYEDIEPNTWYQAGITYDGNIYRGFLNGEQVSQMTIGAITNDLENARLGIGGSYVKNELNYRVYDSNIQDVRVYDRQLSSEEMKSLYNKNSTDGKHIIQTSRGRSITSNKIIDSNFTKNMLTSKNDYHYQIIYRTRAHAWVVSSMPGKSAGFEKAIPYANASGNDDRGLPLDEPVVFRWGTTVNFAGGHPEGFGHAVESQPFKATSDIWHNFHNYRLGGYFSGYISGWIVGNYIEVINLDLNESFRINLSHRPFSYSSGGMHACHFGVNLDGSAPSAIGTSFSGYWQGD